MANRLLRRIAVTIGAGLAAGIGRKLVTRQIFRVAPDPSILLRLDEIESRVSRVEIAPQMVSSPSAEEIEALSTLVSSQREDIVALRQDIQRIERRNAEQAETFGQKVALIEHQLPAHIETSVNSKMADLEEK